MSAKFRQPPYSVAEANIISKSITANGTYNASSDNADGYDPVTVNVPSKTIVSKSITANGTYNASSDNADGYDPVTVNVSASLTETVLWTNDNPTATLNSKTVELSESMDNFDYIAVKCKGTNSLTDLTDATTFIMSVAEFSKVTTSTSTVTNKPILMATMYNNNSIGYARPFVRNNATKIYIQNAISLSNGATDGRYAIPLQISGLKL